MFKQKIQTRMIAALARFASGATARWIGTSPAPTQRIYFANHTSHLDALVLWALLPESSRCRTRPVAARDYWGCTLLRRYLAMQIFHAVLIERPGALAAAAGEPSRRQFAARALARMLEALGGNDSLILFPEGTRGSGATMKPFKSGLYYLARRKPGIELVPVYMENLNRILPKGEYLPVPLLSSVTFGPALYLREAETKTAFLTRAYQSIEELKL